MSTKNFGLSVLALKHNKYDEWSRLSNDKKYLLKKWKNAASKFWVGRWVWLEYIQYKIDEFYELTSLPFLNPQ